MSSKLPLTDAFRRDHTYCTYCPKLCRFSCPVSTAQSRETTTPWGKMTSLHHVADGNLPFTPEYAATWYACTGCMRCRTFCDHDNEVAKALGTGRAEAVRAGTAPKAAYAILDEHPARARRAEQAARGLFGDAACDARARVAFVPGCTASVVQPGQARDGFIATEALAEDDVAVVASGCCGLPLLEAGDPEGFVRAARGFVHRITASGCETAVFLDPGCLYALRRVLPDLAPGITDEDSARLEHLSEYAAARRSRLSAVAQEGPVRYQDPCRLGRGLGVYDAPRAVLEAILGRAPDEQHQRREAAECSGAGGQVPRTDPETARAIAEERMLDHRRAGGGQLVTACPGACHLLDEASGTNEVTSLASLLRRALGK